MVLTKKKRQIGQRSRISDKKDLRVVEAIRTNTTADKGRLLTPEEITEARRKNLEKFKEVARLYGFVMDVE